MPRNVSRGIKDARGCTASLCNLRRNGRGRISHGSLETRHFIAITNMGLFIMASYLDEMQPRVIRELIILTSSWSSAAVATPRLTTRLTSSGRPAKSSILVCENHETRRFLTNSPVSRSCPDFVRARVIAAASLHVVAIMRCACLWCMAEDSRCNRLIKARLETILIRRKRTRN